MFGGFKQSDAFLKRNVFEVIKLVVIVWLSDSFW